MSRQTADEIRRLTSRLQAQSARVLNQVSAASSVLTEFVENDGFEAMEEEIDREEVLLEEECLRVMALHHPIGTDLRFLATLLRANGDLERAADHALGVYRLCQSLFGDATDSLVLLSRQAAQLMGQAVQALLERDPHQAAQVLEANVRLHALSEAALRQARTHAETSDAAALDKAFLMVRIALDLRRIGDLASNLAEDALYLEKGSIVRHGGAIGLGG
jgi:phosphate transport system protein